MEFGTVCKKNFNFGIDEPTEKKARQKLFKKIGYDSYKWRFEVREIKEKLKRKKENKMAVDFSKFDKAVDLDGLKKDVEGAKENTGTFKEVPVGKYEVSVDKMELSESKKGDPMVSIWFKIISGEYKNSRLFFNQVITQGFQIHIVNELLRGMDTGIDIDFESYSQYGQLLLDVHEAVDGQLEFAIEYGENKGFNTFKITEVFEVE